MEFTISKTLLQKELGILQGVVEKKNTIPVLANVLIESIDDEKIRLTGTDLDVTLTTDFQAAEIVEEGSLCLNARKLYEIARLLPDDALVRFKSEPNDWASVKAGQVRYKLPGVNKPQFPEIPKPKPEGIKIPPELLRKAIERTRFAITNEESRYTLSGAKLLITSDQFLMVATDGHRLAILEAKHEFGNAAMKPIDLLVPKKALGEIYKLCAEVKDPVRFTHDDNHLTLEAGARVLVSRLLFGSFPNWELVMPKGNDKLVTVDGAVLNTAMRRVVVMTDQRSHAIRFDIERGQLAISGQSAEEGDGFETVPVEYSGEAIAVGFNAEYLHDFFEVTGGAKAVLSFKDGASQALFSLAEDVAYKYVVMPLRI